MIISNERRNPMKKEKVLQKSAKTVGTIRVGSCSRIPSVRESAKPGKISKEPLMFSASNHISRGIVAIKQGLPFSEAEIFKEKLMIGDDNLSVILGSSTVTVHRKRKKSVPLNACESDRLDRAERLFTYAVSVFGSEEKARSWLTRPQYGLDGHVPLNLLDTDLGVRKVEILIGRIDYGVLP
jgi:putative toxin-antitoxin system antitoxin component (TIGR02293 family)